MEATCFTHQTQLAFFLNDSTWGRCECGKRGVFIHAVQPLRQVHGNKVKGPTMHTPSSPYHHLQSQPKAERKLSETKTQIAMHQDFDGSPVIQS